MQEFERSDLKRILCLDYKFNVYFDDASELREDFVKASNKLMGTGKMIVELFSAAMELSVCRYRSCIACDPDEISSPAAFKNLADRSSPSDIMTLARASLSASASAAIAL